MICSMDYQMIFLQVTAKQKLFQFMNLILAGYWEFIFIIWNNFQLEPKIFHHAKHPYLP